MYTFWEKRSKGRAYEVHWRSICHVLEDEHLHEGALLSGTWKGKPFRAYATSYIAGQYAGSVSEYSVTMPAEHLGPAWTAERDDRSTASRNPHRWTVRANAWSAEARLVEAGLLTVIEEAEQRAVHLDPSVRLLFRPRMTEVTYEDEGDEPPRAEDLIVHLDLVRRAVDVHEAMASSKGHPKGGTRLRTDDPPLWLLSLWFPAALGGAVASDQWPWSLALLPLALAAPHLWRRRIRRA